MKYVNWYQTISAPFRSSRPTRILRGADSALVALFVACYVCLLISTFLIDHRLFAKTVLVPLALFAFVTVIRTLIDLPRPYVAYPITPLIEKDERGHSFPSRHMASAMIIALSAFQVATLTAILLLVAALALGLIRIIGGVHYPKDIFASIVISLLIAAIGYDVIP